MVRQQSTGEGEQFVRRYDYEDEWVVAADVGVGDDHLDVDIVDETAIVLVEGRTEAELDLPGSVERVDTNHGVLVVTGER
ncbi:MAG: Hsp20/alpha crystallin family protein [Haloplanus sp.]